LSQPVRIVVTDNVGGFYEGVGDPLLDPLRGLGELTVHSTRSGSREEFLRRIESATYLLYLRRPGPLDEETFSRAPDLRLVAFPGVGTDHIDLDSARRHGVTISNLPGANAAAVAEHAIGLVFAVARRTVVADGWLRSGQWRKHEGMELGGKTLGVVGLGAIGSRVARLGIGLGMNVLAWSHRRDEERAAGLGVRLVDLDDLLLAADVVSLHLRLTPESAGLLDRRRVGLLRPNAILVNTARAALVDEAALLARLRAGTLGGYGVDVFAVEPMPLEANPYAALENVVMTPHLADETLEANQRLRELLIGNVTAFHGGRPVNVVT
jgi:phosphoglycerate dehydrogenase-like enzyme